MPEIRLRYTKKAKHNAIFAIAWISFIGFAVLGFGYLGFYPPQDQGDFNFFIFMLGLALIVFLFAFWIWATYRISPVIVINEKGIKQKAYTSRFVPWHAIDSLRIGEHPYEPKSHSDLDALYITVNDPKYGKSFSRGMSKVTIWISILLLIATPFIVAFALLSGHPAAMSVIAGFAALGASYNYSKRILKHLGDREIYMSIFELEPDDATLAIDKAEFLKINKKLTPVIIKKFFYDKGDYYK